MAGFNTIRDYAQTSGVPGVATNGSFVGPWINVEDASSIAFQVLLTATSSPVATWGADVTNDPDAQRLSKADAALIPGVTALTLTSDMSDQDPDGTTNDINFLFQFDPSPRAKFMRFKYTRASGGSATATLLKIAVTTWGARS